VPSVSRQLSRLAVLAACAALLAGALAGCSTTQEKAARQQAESKRILDARAKRQERRKHERKTQKDGGAKNE
jgi:outer membrane protein assembly factor BamE (lipoprotein component of BamABCDE complex)